MSNMRKVFLWLVVLSAIIVCSWCQQNDVLSEEDKGVREERQLDDSEAACRCGDPGPWCPVTKPDPRCPCRKVCALRQSGQACDKSDSPCHAEFGLKCHPDLRICQGKLQLQTTEVTHHSVALRWRSPSQKAISSQPTLAYTHTYKGADTQWAQGQAKESTSLVEELQPNTEYFFKVEENGDFEILAVRTKDGCVVNETTSFGLGETYHRGCEQTCECRQGGQSECRERCQFRPGSMINDAACEEVPDAQDSCCVMYKCQDNPLPSSSAKVLVTQRTPSSLTLAWDDFKLPNYESGYVVEYRPIKEGQEEEDWQQVQAGNIPLMTLTKLKPHTEYQIRVLVWEDADLKKRGTGSEVVTIFTEDGCIRGNQTLLVGAEFQEGCDLTCLCKGSDEGDCRDRCSPPLYRAGTGARDPLCSEEPVDSDPCCVTVRCEEHAAGRDAISFSDKSGNCPTLEVSPRDDCPSDCDHDHDCQGSFKCCLNECGKSECHQPLLYKGSCDTVFCGAGAICQGTVTGPTCVCQEGFSGDPNSLEGCLPSEQNKTSTESASTIGCQHLNATYKPGETFFEGCEKRCQCGEDLEVTCEDRCLFKMDGQLQDPLCEILEDPHDACCKILACEASSANQTDFNNSTNEIPPLLSVDELPGTVDTTTETVSTISITSESKTTVPEMQETVAPDTTAMPMDTVEPELDIQSHDSSSKNATQRSMNQNADEVTMVETETKPMEDMVTEDVTAPEDSAVMSDLVPASPETVTELTTNETVTSTENSSDTQPPAVVAVEDKPEDKTTILPDETTPLVTEIIDMDIPSNDTDQSHAPEVKSTDEESSPETTEASPTTVLVPVELSPEREMVSNDTMLNANMTIFVDPEERAMVPEDRSAVTEEIPLVTEETTSTDAPISENSTQILVEEAPGVSPDRKVKMEDGTEIPEDLMTSTPVMDSVNENVEDDTPKKKVLIPARLDGCEYNNATYRRGEEFFDGCEARCHCDGPGLVSCVPRCTLVNAPDEPTAQCKEVPDPNDRCCKILVCERPGDTDAVQNVDELKLIVESAEPQNATTVRLRVTLQASENETLSTGDVLQVWYAPATTATMDPTGAGDMSDSWKKDTFKLADMQQVRPNVYELDIQNLEPLTEYYLKVKRLTRSGSSSITEKGDAYSNTVNVKTFPKSVRGVFKGCFHKNQSYEAGQVFHDGCQYKCLCHERGLIQCQDRCDQYIDHVGFEHCQWGPAPDDPCCTVPYCNEKPPKSNVQKPSEVPDHRDVEIFCMQEETGERHPLGTTWELGEGCKRKVCTCAMRSNGTTLVECTGGCPPIPASVQHPTPECPQPLLVTPDDVCLCPYILCNNNVNHGSCVFDGMHLPNFQPVPQDLLDCGTRCVCVNGNVTCENRCPQLTSSPPPNLPCPPVMAHKGHMPGDDCCQHWVCRQPEESMTEVTCQYNGKKYANEEQWEVRRGTLRRLCLCRMGEVDCRGGCPPIPERFRSPGPQCPRPVLVSPDDPVMCPYVVCNHSLTGKGLQNVSVVVLNSTSVRVRFSLPSLLVGLVGHAELHFTTDPSVPRDAWHVQKFARPQRLFDTANIEYHLTGLKPDTTYFFQVVLAIDALQAGPESEIYKLRLPSVSATITARDPEEVYGPAPVTTTTVAPPPPMIMVDAMLVSRPLTSNSIRVTWRPFEEKEKRYIDGIRLKYRKSNENSWMNTPMIHRDVSSYVIQDLDASASYLIDMEFATPERIPTHLVSTKPLETKTADPPKDEFNFQVSVKPSSANSISSNLSVQGVPDPTSKYVNIARITYKSDTDAEQTVVYKPLVNSYVIVEQLKPGRRYKVWVDLLLTNGKTVSSNVVEVMTKAAAPGAKSLEEPTANFAEALQSGRQSDGHGDGESRSYYIALIVVAVVAAVAALGFVALLVILLRRQSSAKAPITRSPSEAAYDNPTYKTYDGDQRGGVGVVGEHAEKNGNGIQA